MTCGVSGREARLDRLLSEGMVLLSRSKMGLANLFIPGYWKHAAICTSDAASRGQGRIVEATLGRGVVERSLEDFIQDKQDIAVLRPKIPAAALREVAAEAGKRVGAAYDFGFFECDNGHYYCSKLVSDCLRAVTGREPCPLRRVWGRRVVTAHDFYERRHSFEVVYEARGAFAFTRVCASARRSL